MFDMRKTENLCSASSKRSVSVLYYKRVLSTTITANEIHPVRSNHRQLLLNTQSNLELLQEFADNLQCFDIHTFRDAV